VVFPLVPGRVVIPRATLKYSTPVALQFFSQEERFALTSGADTLAVLPLPEAGRPPGFAGAIGSGIRLERRVVPPAARVGEAVAVELALQGEGNTALWPTPEPAWSSAVRAYTDRVEERVTTAEGRVGGIKIFRFLVVPDSAGALPLPAVRYDYFDLAAGRYLTVDLPAGSVPVAPGGELAASTALPPPLLRAGAAAGVAAGTCRPRLGLASGAVAATRRAGHREAGRFRSGSESSRVAPGPPHRRPERLAEAEDEPTRWCRHWCPISTGEAEPPQRRCGRRGGRRACGSAAAARPAARTALRPHRRPGGRPGLAGEVRDLVSAWAARPGWRVGERPCSSCWRPAGNAAPGPGAGAGGALRAGLAHRGSRGVRPPGEAAPAVPSTGTTSGSYYRLGAQDARCGGVASRASPCSSEVRQALRSPPPDATSARWTWSPPVTPEELLLGALGWLIGWAG
jgi:hypothetical protein